VKREWIKWNRWASDFCFSHTFLVQVDCDKRIQIYYCLLFLFHLFSLLFLVFFSYVFVVVHGICCVFFVWNYFFFFNSMNKKKRIIIKVNKWTNSIKETLFQTPFSFVMVYYTIYTNVRVKYVYIYQCMLRFTDLTNNTFYLYE
jgi:hypothetical protein